MNFTFDFLGEHTAAWPFSGLQVLKHIALCFFFLFFLFSFSHGPLRRKQPHSEADMIN